MTSSNATHSPAWTWAPLLLLAACGPGPTINSFTATPSQVPYGDPVQLSWDVKDASSVEVSGVGRFNADQTSAQVTPTQPTTYTLTASGFWSKTTATATVTPVPKLQVRGGTYSGGVLGLTVAALLRDAAGAVPSGDTTLTIAPPAPAAPFTVTCPGGRPLCLVALPAIAPTGGGYTASATVAGASLTSAFTVNPASRLPQVSVLSVQQAGAQALTATWSPAPGATSYRVQAVDLNNPDQPFGPTQVVSGASATVATSQAMSPTGSYGVRVEASVLDLGLSTAPATLPAPDISRASGRAGAQSDAWQYFDSTAWKGGNTLQVSFTNLSATSEHLAVLVLNVGGRESANATVSVTGTLPQPPPPEAARMMPLLPGDGGAGFPRTPASFHEALRREEEQLAQRVRADTLPPAPAAAPLPPGPAPATASFCVRRGIGSPAVFIRKQATLQGESAHAVFYVDNDDTSQYTADLNTWSTLTNLWESRVYPGDTATFGAESDVDGNGKLTVLLSGELGQAQGGGILLGYFSANDSYYPLDTTTACSGSATASQNKGSNHADLFFLNSLSNIMGAGAKAQDIVSRIYPDTLAHEFQHLINFNQHCLLHRSTCALEDTWINEGLSMVAEEIGGFGWNSSDGRRSGALYLDRLPSSDLDLSYNGRSLTLWEGDPIGNYEGAHAFFRYYADRLGPSVLGQLVQSSTIGQENLESGLGMTFGRAYAEWSTALMFSNEAFSPGVDQFNFKGANWTPFHQKLRYLNYQSLNSSPVSLTLREDGWNALLTGAASGSSAVLTISSTEVLKPTVVVIRVNGALPRQ